MKTHKKTYNVNDLVVIGRHENPYCECGGLKININDENNKIVGFICNICEELYSTEDYHEFH